jgi:LmbE family N-acetylglucosaminyl deacetylase
MRKPFTPVRLLCLAILLFLLAVCARAQDAYAPLPQDKGKAGLEEMLRRLQTTARLIHTTAHPDDEDGGMLAFESRGRGVTALHLTLNRGEGGQNKMGSNLLDELGILRTLELLAADRYYGVEQRFTRVADFGYSKSADETFRKWGGHDPALTDLVRVIREFRPDVIVSRFQGTRQDRHGQHEAAGILTREAFRAAADPNRFPEQIRAGLQPWQAKKLYVDNVRPPQQSTLKLDTSAHDSLLGMSYIEFAMQGLKHQLSQGAGSWQVPPGPHFSYYRLVDSVLPRNEKGEADFFDGIDTSLPGLAKRLGDEEATVPFLSGSLKQIAAQIEEAARRVRHGQTQSAAKPLLVALKDVNNSLKRIRDSRLPAAARSELERQLRAKQMQLQQAANLALGISLEAKVEAHGAVVFPGESYAGKVSFNAPAGVLLRSVEIDLPEGWRVSYGDTKQHGTDFNLTLPPNAAYNRPYWRRDDPNRDAVYVVEDARWATLPFAPPPVHANATYEFGGETGVISAVAKLRAGNRDLPLAVGPAFSLAVAPPTQVVRAGGSSTADLSVFAGRPVRGELRLQAPQGWKLEPASRAVNFPHASATRNFQFKFTPDAVNEGQYELRAELDTGGQKYTEGLTVITREDLPVAYFYRPAVQRVSVVEVKVPRGLKVGYIMGAGDEIPAVLKQIGLEVEIITPEQLATGDLGRYRTIVAGIRAYDTHEDLRAHNRRLLEYVSAGGTLVVQYNAGLAEFNAGQYTPFPAQLSRERVSVEEAAVELLAPQDSVFNFPNQITARDFHGWVQERGLYFMGQWDSHFEPLLASHDPGEPPHKGGLLRARYGKGTYIYTGYAFFRQLPAGVPGAIRLFVNLVSAGHE